MKTKYLTYHGTKKENLESILNYGLKMFGGVYGLGVYTTSSIKSAGEFGDTIIAIPMRTNESRFVTPLNKFCKWYISKTDIPADRLFYAIVEDKDAKKITKYQVNNTTVISIPYNGADERSYLLGKINNFLVRDVKRRLPYEPDMNKIRVSEAYNTRKIIGKLPEYYNQYSQLKVR